MPGRLIANNTPKIVHTAITSISVNASYALKKHLCELLRSINDLVGSLKK